MPVVKVSHKTKSAPDETFKSIKNLFSNDAQLKKLDPDYQLSLTDSNRSGQIKSKLFKAEIQVNPDGAGAEVTVSVDLPFHLALIKGVVERSLKEKLGEYFKS